MDNLKFYTGVGSRNTPKDVMDEMYLIGVYLSEKGYILRSGNARGADSAFQMGCDSVNGDSEIYLPLENFGTLKRNTILVKDTKILLQAFEIAKSVKSKTYVWNKKNKPFHTRNVFQVLGFHLNKPSDFVLCWTDTGAENHDEIINRNDKSGTSTAISLASIYNIPVFNMYNKDWLKRFENFIDINN